MPEYDLGQFQQMFQNMGITNPYDTSGVAQAISKLTGNEVDPNMVTQLSQENLKAADPGTYAPVVAAKSQNLLGELVSTLGGSKMTQAAGGFGGTASTSLVETGGRDVYGKKASDILKGVAEASAKGKQNIHGIIQSWRNIKGTQQGTV